MLEQDVEYDDKVLSRVLSIWTVLYRLCTEPFESQAVCRKKRKDKVEWKTKAVDVQDVPQIDTGKHKGAIDYEVLAASANAPLRIQKDHQESSAQATPGIEDAGQQRQETISEGFKGITPIEPPHPYPHPNDYHIFEQKRAE